MEYLGYIFNIIWSVFTFMFGFDITNPVFIVVGLLVVSSIVMGTFFLVLGWRSKK